MSVFAIADLHLSGDPSIGKPMDKFGENWADHDKKIQNRWMETVSEDDTVIVAGDISWGLKLEEAMTDLEWIDKLPGHKVFIKGNHDLWWQGITKLNSLFDSITFLQNKSFDAGECIICGSRGWECPGAHGFEAEDQKIYEREVLRLEMSLEDAAEKAKGREMIGVLHYPPTNDKYQPSDFTALFEKYGIKKVVYGHLHNEEGFKKGYKGNMNGVSYRLVSVDYVDFTPVKLL